MGKHAKGDFILPLYVIGLLISLKRLDYNTTKQNASIELWIIWGSSAVNNGTNTIEKGISSASSFYIDLLNMIFNCSSSSSSNVSIKAQLNPSLPSAITGGNI